MNYQDWLTTVPAEITQDPLWNLEVYRLGVFVADIGWEDIVYLEKNKITRDAADQIHRSLDSISANIAEGYSRSTGKDRARYLEYALGEAREARDRYFKARRALRVRSGYASHQVVNPNSENAKRPRTYTTKARHS